MKLNQNKALLGLIVILVISSSLTLALADVVFTYNGVVNAAVIAQPISFSVGPNGDSSYESTSYVSTTVGPGNAGFTVDVGVTNAASVYYYQVVTLTVSDPGYLYLNNETISGSSGSAIENMYVYIGEEGATTNSAIQVISSGGPVTPPPAPPSGAISLSPGTYYISIKVEPVLPITSSVGTTVETVTLRFGYNVVSTSELSVP
ncbi:MAG: hypothetical protein ACP5T2_06255 [Thermoprotei archaeon]